MSLSADEQAWAMAIYRRNRLWRKYRWPDFAWIGALFPWVILSPDLIRDLRSPHAGQHIIYFCILGLQLGIVLGMVIIQALLLPKLRQRDQEILTFLENHFSEECPWKQEETLLRQAEELQRKAKVAAMPSVVGNS
jgi:hypothetical protein